MKTGTLAKALGISRDTVLRYANMQQFEPFLSDGATGKNNRPHRIYNNADVLVMNTIVYLLNTEKLRGWDEIAARIASGFRHEQFSEYVIPEDSYSIPRPQAEQFALAAAKVQELETANNQIKELKEKISSLEADKDQSAKEIAELNKRIGFLEGRLAEIDKPGFWSRFRRGSDNE